MATTPTIDQHAVNRPRLVERLDRLVLAAQTIAAGAPAKPGKYVTDAKIYWPKIIELREALDALDIEWR